MTEMSEAVLRLYPADDGDGDLWSDAALDARFGAGHWLRRRGYIEARLPIPPGQVYLSTTANGPAGLIAGEEDDEPGAGEAGRGGVAG